MTRKEPQFGDDIQQPIETAELNPLTQNKPSQVSSDDLRTSNNWLLWIFVVTSLLISFGVAFFGLEEAGKYKAALTQAKEQSQELQVMLEQLNQTQVRGIGELVQSDAQMRKMVAGVERRIETEYGDRITQMQAQIVAQSKALEFNNASITDLKKILDETQDASTISSKRISENTLLLSEIGTEFDVVRKATNNNSRLVNDLSNRITFQESSVDEALALVREQISAVRGRLDRLSEINDAFVELSDKVKKLNTMSTAVERSIKEMEVSQAAIEQTLVGLERTLELNQSELVNLSEKYNVLENDTVSSLAIDNLRKKQDGLQNQLNEQNDLLQSVDSSRKILNKRLIDLDARILALTPKDQ